MLFVEPHARTAFLEELHLVAFPKRKCLPVPATVAAFRFAGVSRCSFRRARSFRKAGPQKWFQTSRRSTRGEENRKHPVFERALLISPLGDFFRLFPPLVGHVR